MPAPIAGLRQAILRALRQDKRLQRLLNPAGATENPHAIMYRMAREQVAVRSITFFDFGSRPDNMVPLHDRRFQFDIWVAAEDADVGEELAILLNFALEAAQPFTEALWVASLNLLSDVDNLIPEAFLSRKTLFYQMLAYERATTGLVGAADLHLTITEPAL